MFAAALRSDDMAFEELMSLDELNRLQRRSAIEILTGTNFSAEARDLMEKGGRVLFDGLAWSPPIDWNEHPPIDWNDTAVAIHRHAWKRRSIGGPEVGALVILVVLSAALAAIVGFAIARFCCLSGNDQEGGAAPVNKDRPQGQAEPTDMLYPHDGDDAAKFDWAFDMHNLPEFVRLLPSTELIEDFKEQMHPWAQNATTVGALSAFRLALVVSMSQDPPKDKRAIREAGAIPPLVEFLRSGERDRAEAGVVALSLLTANDPQCIAAAYDAGALQGLLRHVDSPVKGMREETMKALLNICSEKEEYHEKFLQLGGDRTLLA